MPESLRALPNPKLSSPNLLAGELKLINKLPLPLLAFRLTPPINTLPLLNFSANAAVTTLFSTAFVEVVLKAES